VEVLYLDNVETMVYEWEKILLDDAEAHAAGLSSVADRCERVQGKLQVKLKQDAFHLMDRYARTTAGPGNPAHEPFMRELSEAIFTVHGPDAATVAAADGSRQSNAASFEAIKEKYCRRYAL
jgi:hypothetical protein